MKTEKSWVQLANLNLVILKRVFEWLDMEARIVMGLKDNLKTTKQILVLECECLFNAEKCY
jgi:hypothetical protein